MHFFGSIIHVTVIVVLVSSATANEVLDINPLRLESANVDDVEQSMTEQMLLAPLNINTVQYNELLVIPYMQANVARAIVQEREHNGSYHSFSDLELRLKRVQFNWQEIKVYISFSELASNLQTQLEFRSLFSQAEQFHEKSIKRNQYFTFAINKGTDYKLNASIHPYTYHLVSYDRGSGALLMSTSEPTMLLSTYSVERDWSFGKIILGDFKLDLGQGLLVKNTYTRAPQQLSSQRRLSANIADAKLKKKEGFSGVATEYRFNKANTHKLIMFYSRQNQSLYQYYFQYQADPWYGDCSRSEIRCDGFEWQDNAWWGGHVIDEKSRQVVSYQTLDNIYRENVSGFSYSMSSKTQHYQLNFLQSTYQFLLEDIELRFAPHSGKYGLNQQHALSFYISFKQANYQFNSEWAQLQNDALASVNQLHWLWWPSAQFELTQWYYSPDYTHNLAKAISSSHTIESYSERNELGLQLTARYNGWSKTHPSLRIKIWDYPYKQHDSAKQHSWRTRQMKRPNSIVSHNWRYQINSWAELRMSQFFSLQYFPSIELGKEIIDDRVQQFSQASGLGWQVKHWSFYHAYQYQYYVYGSHKRLQVIKQSLKSYIDWKPTRRFSMLMRLSIKKQDSLYKQRVLTKDLPESSIMISARFQKRKTVFFEILARYNDSYEFQPHKKLKILSVRAQYIF